MLTVVKAGLQTTLQGAPFSGHRYLGMPAAGAADCLSLALANRLVGNMPHATAVEITLDEAKFTVERPGILSLTGAAGFLRVDGKNRCLHEGISVKPGNEIHIGPATQGCRSYLAVAGKIEARSLLGGQSTYLGAGLGGFQGRALKAGDRIKSANGSSSPSAQRETPETLRPKISNNFILRINTGPEIAILTPYSQTILFEKTYKVGGRTNRMGSSLNGPTLEQRSLVQMKSAAVFPGTVQCPPDGEPFLLGPDAQTTGGYPRIAQVIRADRHLIGQIRMGSVIQFVKVSNERATDIYRKKLSLLTPWLGAVSLW